MYTGTGTASARLNKQYSLINFRTNGGDSLYNGLNTRFELRNLRRQGLTLRADYTWGKDVNDGSSTIRLLGMCRTRLWHSAQNGPVCGRIVTNRARCCVARPRSRFWEHPARGGGPRVPPASMPIRFPVAIQVAMNWTDTLMVYDQELNDLLDDLESSRFARIGFASREHKSIRKSTDSRESCDRRDAGRAFRTPHGSSVGGMAMPNPCSTETACTKPSARTAVLWIQTRGFWLEFQPSAGYRPFRIALPVNLSNPRTQEFEQ